MNRIFGDLPPVVKNLIIINVVMLLVMYAVKAMSGVDLNAILGLYFPKSDSFRSWQIVTHMFMHGSFIHLFLNMFALWMFGRVLEQVWGPRRFLVFYLVTGLGAAFTFELVQWMQYNKVMAVLSPEQLQYVYDSGGEVVRQGRTLPISRWETEQHTYRTCCGRLGSRLRRVARLRGALPQHSAYADLPSHTY